MFMKYLRNPISQSTLRHVAFVIALLCFSSFNISAQTDTINPDHYRVGYGPLLDPGIEPTYLLKIDTLLISTDTSFTKRLKPEWIRKIVIVKDSKYERLYSPLANESSILIIIKKKYFTLINDMLKG